MKKNFLNTAVKKVIIFFQVVIELYEKLNTFQISNFNFLKKKISNFPKTYYLENNVYRNIHFWTKKKIVKKVL